MTDEATAHPLAKAAVEVHNAARVHTAESKAKMSAAARRRFKDPAERKKISTALRGRAFSDEHRAKLSALNRELTGARGRRWKGDDVGYHGVHYRAKKVLPRSCALADETCKGRLEVALRRDAPEEFVREDPRIGRLYSPRVEDYQHLCVSHHRRYDL